MARLRSAAAPVRRGTARADARALALWLAMQASIAAAAPDTQLAQGSLSSLSRLTIEELAEIRISSVSKRPERLADAAAAVYVITRDDIRRAGVVSLPEALRL